jgi:hypothetical protein
MERVVGFFESTIAPLCYNLEIPGCYCQNEPGDGKDLGDKGHGGHQRQLTGEDGTRTTGVRKVRRGAGRQIQ